MKVKGEDVIGKMIGRLSRIKKGTICFINSEVFDVTIDHLIYDAQSFRKRPKFANCKIVLKVDKIFMGAEFGNRRTEGYNVRLIVEYHRSKDQPEEEFYAYYYHLPLWMYIVLNDATTTVNDFWDLLKTKPTGSKIIWTIEKEDQPKSFIGELKIPLHVLQPNIDKMSI
jgi:hypothetical protein